MKKCTLLLLLLLPVLLCAACSAGSAADYTVTSVCDSAASVANYREFAASGELSVVIPGLNEGFVPQGLTYLPGEDSFVFAGYRTDKGPSALIQVDRASGRIVRQVTLRYKNGSVYNGHAGGICATETQLYISNDGHLYRIPLTDFLALGEKADCRFAEELPVPGRASYCSYADGYVWCGEFEYGKSYPTDASHVTKTADGTVRAWLCGWKAESGLVSGTPDVILATGEKIQGMTMLNGSIYLSRSYGRKSTSSIIRYRNVLDDEPNSHVEVDGRQVPLWCLDSTAWTGRIFAPPGTECLCTADGAVWVLFEMAAQTYMQPTNPSSDPVDRIFRMTGF